MAVHASDEECTLLNPEGLAAARRFGWVYEYQGRVALTGAGAYHAGEIRGGMLGGWTVQA